MQKQLWPQLVIGGFLSRLRVRVDRGPNKSAFGLNTSAAWRRDLYSLLMWTQRVDTPRIGRVTQLIIMGSHGTHWWRLNISVLGISFDRGMVGAYHLTTIRFTRKSAIGVRIDQLGGKVRWADDQP